MIFKSVTGLARLERNAQWRRWFAWYPVTIGSDIVWFQWVERRRPFDCDGEYACRDYRHPAP